MICLMGRTMGGRMNIQGLLNQFPAMFIVVNFNGGEPYFEYVSAGCLTLTGYTPEELVGQSSMRALSYPGDIPHTTSFGRMHQKHGMTPDNPFFESIFRIVTAQSTVKWVREFGTAIFNGSEFVGIVALVFDCSQGKNLEFIFERQFGDEQHSQFYGMIGRSHVMQELYRRILFVAPTGAPVFITGETGTGKELVARAIHTLGCPQAPFVAVNCGGISEGILESELFGHVKGAYTGAHSAKKGYLEQAAGGVLFLDEIGEIPLTMQVKLLRALDGYGFVPVGGTALQQCRFRLVSATNQNPQELVRAGRMKHDFLYRINALSLHVPALRERAEDIPLLTDLFLRMFSQPGKELLIQNHIHLTLREYGWPGNIRELRNTIHNYVTLGVLNIPSYTEKTSRTNSARTGTFVSSPKAQRDYAQIVEALSLFPEKRKDAAAHLGIHPRTLHRKMLRYGLLTSTDDDGDKLS